MIIQKEKFDFNYFERGIETGISGYSNYRWIPELTIPLCDSIAEWTGITKNDSILDFGCAKGYLVYGFKLLHYDCFGVDISEYAINSSPKEVKSYIKHLDSNFINDEKIIINSFNKKFDWIICKDVLEHVDMNNLKPTINLIKESCNRSAIIVPLGNGSRYNISSYDNDVTHVIKQPIEWWKNVFESVGLKVISNSFKEKNIKQNYSMYENGNGFFILHS